MVIEWMDGGSDGNGLRMRSGDEGGILLTGTSSSILRKAASGEGPHLWTEGVGPGFPAGGCGKL